MEPRVEYARTSDGVTIAFAAVGEGEPLVMLPSLPFNDFLAEWQVPPVRAALERLTAHFRLIRYDARGTGHSQRDVDELSFGSMLTDLDAVLVQTGAIGAGLVGLYNSCPIAIAAAATWPERVARLALFGGTARGWAAMRERETQALLSLIEQDWELFTETAAHSWMGWSAGEAARLAARSFREGVTPAVARATLQVASGVDVTEHVARVTQPALVLHKPGLRQLDRAAAEALADALPDGRFVELPGDSAALFVDHGQAAAEALAGFFGASTVPLAAIEAGAAGETLTARERQVIARLAGGASNGEIAADLGISIHTVERHVANAYRKIDARGRADATAWAIRKGML